MRCSAAKKLISDYIDGTIQARQSARLEQHLGVCQDCKKLLADFKTIIEGAKELEELAPPEKTWLKIKTRLKPEEQRILSFRPQKRAWFSLPLFPSKLKYVLISVLLLAFVVGGVTVGLRLWMGNDFMSREDMQKYALAKLDEAERHYQLAIKALWDAASAQEGKMDPQVAEVFRRNLEIIDSSIIACRQTILQEPDNIEARSYLLAAYREKVNFLNGMMEIAKTSSSKRELKTTI